MKFFNSEKGHFSKQNIIVIFRYFRVDPGTNLDQDVVQNFWNTDVLFDNNGDWVFRFLQTTFSSILLGEDDPDFYRDVGNRSTFTAELDDYDMDNYEPAKYGQWIPITDFDGKELLTSFTCMKKRPECPPSHPFAFHNGTRCCSDGTEISVQSDICNGEYEDWELICLQIKFINNITLICA